MGVVGYDKVATKVIEGKSKCIYKKPKGTKEYVMGFGKIRTVESYVKLCRKKAAKSKMAAKPKMAKPKMAKKMRSKSAKRYGGFLEQFFAENTESFGAPGAPSKDKEKYPSPPPMGEKYMNEEHMVDPELIMKNIMSTVKGGSSCYKGGQQQQKQQQQQQQKYGGQEQAGGKRRKKHTSNKSVLKMMMAAFKNKSAKKQKGKRRRGGGEDDDE
jgi:hypothetical protein